MINSLRRAVQYSLCTLNNHEDRTITVYTLWYSQETLILHTSHQNKLSRLYCAIYQTEYTKSNTVRAQNIFLIFTQLNDNVPVHEVQKPICMRKRKSPENVTKTAWLIKCRALIIIICLMLPDFSKNYLSDSLELQYYTV